MAVKYALIRLRLYRPITRTSEKVYLETSGCDTAALEDLTRGNVL